VTDPKIPNQRKHSQAGGGSASLEEDLELARSRNSYTRSAIHGIENDGVDGNEANAAERYTVGLSRL